METITSVLAVLAGLLLRLAIPIALTAILIFFLRKLDVRWQRESQFPVLPIQKVDCWKIKECPEEQYQNCIGATSPLPCWQVKRLPNGYLREECLSCEVFIKAPIPSLQPEPRRM